jgi:uncharacterized MAPEG superfamily protein
VSPLLLCIPAAFFLIYLPKIAVSVAMGKQPEGYNNRNPRDQQTKLTGWGKRALGAHLNGFESFPPFAAGVLIAHVSQANPKHALYLAVGHLACRTLYPVLYIADIHAARSVVWALGFVSTMWLMLLPLFG